MAASETETGVDVVSKGPKDAELRYRVSVDDSGTRVTLASIAATRASDAVDGGSLVFSTDAIDGDVTPRMVIDSNGSVGIGVTSPGARLHVDGDARFTGPLTIEAALNGRSLSVGGPAEITGAFKVGGDVIVAGRLEASGFVGDGGELRNVVPKDGAVGNAQLASDFSSLKKVSGGVMTVRDGSKVGIGTERPERELHVCDDGNAEIIIEQTQAKSDFKRWNLVVDGGNAQTPSKFYIRQLNDAGTAGNVPLMINGEGRVIITKLQLGHKWLLSGDRDWWADDDWLRLANTQVGDYWGGFAAGRLWSNSGMLSGSDVRLKTDISSLGSMADKLMALRGVRFKWRDAKNEEPRIGLIAQEVEEVIPEVVETGPDCMKGFNYAGLVAAIIGVLQDQEIELRRLRAEVTSAPARSAVGVNHMEDGPGQDSR